MDSTGIKFLDKGELTRKKHGAEYRRQWHKVHLGIDAQTLEIRSVEVSDNSVGDAPMRPELLAQIPAAHFARHGQRFRHRGRELRSSWIV